jgi:heme-degrading monooxygenase HmoA
MYVIIWEYLVKAERSSQFEKIYGTTGAWADLFRKQNGYLGTELLRDSQGHERYLTIDRWESLGDYESFLSRWKKEYEALDVLCAGLTENETMIGRWETTEQETR